MPIAQASGRPAHQAELPRLSVVIPSFNEESLLAETHARVRHCLDRLGVPFEIIYVDDGSTDGTYCVLQEIQERDPAVRVVRLSRNFGHQIAITAGMDDSIGATVVILDADLQDPPEMIEEMLTHWRNGAQVVFGVRRERAGESILRLLVTNAYYRLISWMSDLPLSVGAADFRLLDRKVVDLMKTMREPDRYLRGMIPWLGFRQVAVHYDRAARTSGCRKYSLAQLIKLAMNGMTSCVNPMRLCFGMSACMFLAGIAILAAAASSKYGQNLGTIGVVIALFGVQTFWSGILGEYVVRSYKAGMGRPLYVVQERLGGPQSCQHGGLNAVQGRKCEEFIRV